MMKRNKMHISILALSLLSFGILSIGSLRPANASHISNQNSQAQTIKIGHIKHLYHYKNTNNISKTNIKKNNIMANNSKIRKHHHNHHNHHNNHHKYESINAMNYVQVKVHHNHRRMTKSNNDYTAPKNPADEEQGVKVNFKATPINYKSLDHQNHHDWFREGLNNQDFNARQTIVSRESGGHWNILSYGHRCIGYFQLDPAYLGYKHGHLNLSHKHQVKVADRYVKNRYGSWVNALHFWNINHWY